MAQNVVKDFITPTNIIQVRVVDFPNGLRVFDNVLMARLKSSGYNLLVMADHIPVIGEVDGSIELVFDDDIVKFDDVRAFYMHRANVLSLLIKDYKW